MAKSFEELRALRVAANEKLGDLYLGAANRELTAEESMVELNLKRELERIDSDMRGINLESENRKAVAKRESELKGEKLREYLGAVRQGKADREITLGVLTEGSQANIESSAAINLTINDIIPTLEEGTGLPVGLQVVTGVVGNEVWPVSISDVEMEEVGEIAELTDQALDFDNIVPVSRRVGVTVPVSNRAIDNAAFDLMGFVQTKFTKAMREYLAKKIYSQANFTGNKGPFGGLTAGTIDLTTNAYAAILNAVAEFTNKGLDDAAICLSMDRVTEAQLKATPKVAGAAAGFVIENGLCAGYPYTVSHYVNTTLQGEEIVATEDKYLEIGFWNYFALQQHDNVRLTIDATSQAVAKKNITAITLNTAWSMTDLSVKLNGASSSQAFALLKIQ